MITIKDIEQGIREIFDEEEGKVRTLDCVWELSDDEKFWKLVISIHNLSVEDTLIIHTKFIFKSDLNKSELIENSFQYLYDINCIYHKVQFENIIDLKRKLEDIIETNDFGEDIKILSDFIEAPAMFLNYYMKRAKITEYSIFEVRYDPKFKTQPCYRTTFDFDINVNNSYHIFLSISKKSRKKENYYVFQFRFMDKYISLENETLQNIHFIIGSQIAKILDKNLK